MSDEGLVAILRAVDGLGARWMLGGSLGSMCYSEPRATLDADCIIDLRPQDAPRIAAAFPEIDFYVPPETVVAHELRRGARGTFNVIHHASGFKADIYPIGDDYLMRWGLARSRRLPVAGLEMPVAPPEYIVAMKLRYFALSGQDKHLRDIRSLVRLQPGLDHQAIIGWAECYGVTDAWRLALPPPDSNRP